MIDYEKYVAEERLKKSSSVVLENEKTDDDDFNTESGE